MSKKIKIGMNEELSALINPLQLNFDTAYIKQESLNNDLVWSIYNEQGEWFSTNFEEDFWSYLQVEKSQMGAWQAYLLSQMWHYLPLQWHANYSYRDYIYSQSSKSYDILREHFIAGKHQVAPQITQEGDKFLISACYWSEFEGLVREHYAVTFENDRVYVEELDANILYEYDCGIQF